jgi:hypothetical protein
VLVHLCLNPARHSVPNVHVAHAIEIFTDVGFLVVMAV